MDDYLEFVDDLRQVCSDSIVAGPANDYMVTNLSNFRDLAKREYTHFVFISCCLCLCHVCPSLPSVRPGSPTLGLSEYDFSAKFEPLQTYILSNQLERSVFTEPDSITKCIEIVESFADQAFRPDYTPLDSVDVHGREHNIRELSRS